MEAVETSALTPEQLRIVQDDLGITENKSNIVLENLRAEEAEEQLQTNINTEKERAEDAELNLGNSVESINSLIPSQATETNQLADKEFVNSTVGTNTAIFRGTFNSLEELEAYSGDKTNNDYAFVITGADVTRAFNRYKYNGSAWEYEYTLNNSSFTSEQWEAINSGITSDLIAYLETFSIDNALSDFGENAIINKVVTQNIYGYLNTETVQGSNTEDHNFIVASGNVLVRNGTTLKVTFTKDCYSATATTAPVDSAYPKISVDNGATYYPVYVNQHGTPIPIPSHQIVSRNSLANYHWWWQSYTTLELMFVSDLGENGVWLIMGNPETVSYNSSTESYKIKADGLIKQSIKSWKNTDGLTFNFFIVFTNTNYSFPNYLGGINAIASTGFNKSLNKVFISNDTRVVYMYDITVEGY